MLKIALWEVLQGQGSPARWARDVRENLVVQWLGQGIQPSRTALYDFRDRLADVIQNLHAEAVRQGIAEGLIHPQEGVQDGTAVRACASRHRLLNFSVLNQRREELATAIAADQAGQPLSQIPRWMASTPLGRRGQSGRYATAHEVLQQRLAENSRRPKDKRLPESRVRVSPSDPQATPGRDKEKTYCPLYTTQFVVGSQSLVCLAFEVFAQATDAGTLAILLDRTQAVTGQPLVSLTADAAYSSLRDIQECRQRKVELYAPLNENDFTAKKKRAKSSPPRLGRDAFTWLADEQTYQCPQGHRLKYLYQERRSRSGNQHVIQHRFRCPPEYCQNCPLRDRCVKDPAKGRTVQRLEGQELIDAHRAKMNTPGGQAKRKQRGQVIERSFADAKEHRHLRRLHGRGLSRARAEIGLVVLAQTVLAINRLRLSLVTLEENSP